MRICKFLCVVILVTAVLSGCAKKHKKKQEIRDAVRPAISQSAVMVQRYDAKSGYGGKISISIDDRAVIAGLSDSETGSTVVNNGVHFIQAVCQNDKKKTKSSALNFTANSGTVAFLVAYGKDDCRLERMAVDDDTGYMTNEKQQQSYYKQDKSKPKNYDPYAELERLADLKEKGIITNEEFQIQKDKILGY